MDAELKKQVPAHMRSFACRVLAMANYHSHLINRAGHGGWPEVAVVEAAHAAEIFIKARIAEEHPMLIFERTPNSGGKPPALEHLLDTPTIAYSDLPGFLLACTGIELPYPQLFKEFGRLRNRVQHFLPPANVDLGLEALKFTFGVVDPFIHQCWGLYAVDYNEDDAGYEYFVEALKRNEIPFLVSQGAARRWKSACLYEEPPSRRYLSLMNKRVIEAGGEPHEPIHSRRPSAKKR